MSPEPIPVELRTAYRLLNHGPTVLVSSQHAGRANIMAAAWSMALDFNPPKVCVVIDKATLTRELVDASGEFVLNIPCREQAETTLAVGHRSGRDGDKFAELKLEARPGSHVAAPLLVGCVGWLECKVIPEPRNQQVYDLYIGEVVAAWADPRSYSNGRWTLNADSPRSIHYISGGAFFETGEQFELPIPD